jgi:WD40 repeat protein
MGQRPGGLLPSIQAGREILGIGVSPDGTKRATIPGDGPVQLWELVESKTIADLGGTGGYDTFDTAFSPDGRYLATDLATGIFLWRISDSELIWNEIKNSMAVAYSPDGRYLAYSDIDDNNKVILASPDGQQVIRSIQDMQGPVWELIFSPDSSLLAATNGIEVRIWQVSEGKLFFIGKLTCP